MYNKNNSIILEFVPVYPWHFCDPEPNDNFVEYDDFIKDFKPFLIVEINKEIAQEWLGQVNQLLSKILSCDGVTRLFDEEGKYTW